MLFSSVTYSLSCQDLPSPAHRALDMQSTLCQNFTYFAVNVAAFTSPAFVHYMAESSAGFPLLPQYPHFHTKCARYFTWHVAGCSNGSVYGLAVCKMLSSVPQAVLCIGVLIGRGSSTELGAGVLCFVPWTEGKTQTHGWMPYNCANGNIGIQKGVYIWGT